MSSANASSPLASLIKKPVSRPLVGSGADAKRFSRPEGSSRPPTSAGKTVALSAGRTATPLSRPESRLPSKGKDEQGSKGRPTVSTSSVLRPEKTKQPVQGIRKEEPGSKGKEVVRSVEVKKTPASTSKTDTKNTKTTKKTGTRGKTEKKVYSLPGQKHDPPEEREPLRIFYESLYKQIPTSEMAEFWMMEYGLLSPEKAKKAYDKKQKRQHQLRTGTPVKSAVKFDRPESSKKTQSINNGNMKAKKRANYSDDDDDFIVKKKFRV